VPGVTPEAIAARLAELGVRVRNQPVTAADIPALQAVRISSPASQQVTDADCALFQHLPRLTSLGIVGARQVTPAGISEIAQCTTVRFLDLTQTPVGDAWLEALSANRSVINLPLNGSTGINDAGFAHLRRMEQLTDLGLVSQGGMTDAGLANLSALGKLRTLWMNNTQVTDAGMETVARLPTLTWVAVGQTRVGDAGLLAIVRNPNISNVSGSRRRITQDGIAAAMAVPGRHPRLTVRI